MNDRACEAQEASCQCIRTTRHKIHRCDCGGAWGYGADGTMIPRVFPGGEKNLGKAIDRLFDPFAGLLR